MPAPEHINILLCSVGGFFVLRPSKQIMPCRWREASSTIVKRWCWDLLVNHVGSGSGRADSAFRPARCLYLVRWGCFATFGHYHGSFVATPYNELASESKVCQWGMMYGVKIVRRCRAAWGRHRYKNVLVDPSAALSSTQSNNPTIRLFSPKWNLNLIEYWLSRWYMWCVETWWEWVINMIKMEVESWKLVLIWGEKKRSDNTREWVLDDEDYEREKERQEDD